MPEKSRIRARGPDEGLLLFLESSGFVEETYHTFSYSPAKYTDGGGKIQVETRANGTDAVITIADSGAGISAELLPRVFDLFVHGGRITAASPGLGQGATSEIHLPRVERPQESAGRGEGIKAASRRILIVDDNADAANSLAQVLGLDGHITEPVYSAQEALSRASSFAPEVVLLDLGLPEMDGYEVARRLRERPEFAAVRMVALTGYGQSENVRRSWEAGFDDHLTKAVDFAALDRVLAGLPSSSS